MFYKTGRRSQSKVNFVGFDLMISEACIIKLFTAVINPNGTSGSVCHCQVPPPWSNVCGKAGEPTLTGPRIKGRLLNWVD